MTQYPIVWRPAARSDLLALYDWISDWADPDTAYRYTSAVEAQVVKLGRFPRRGTPRDDLVPGMRTISFRGRTIIAYRVDQSKVEILRLLHSGQDWPDGDENDGE